MPKFKVTYTETESKSVIVEAADKEAAKDLVDSWILGDACEPVPEPERRSEFYEYEGIDDVIEVK
jgi:hypothetical protein